jgi:hypothetical protein
MSAAATAALARAIEQCDTAWRERFERSPRAVELVHAFEICLGASAEYLVSNVDECVAVTDPAAPKPAGDGEGDERRRIRPTDLDVVISRGPNLWEPDAGRAWRKAEEGRGPLMLEMLLEMGAPPSTTLIVDYKNLGALTQSELRSFTKAKLVHQYATLHRATIERVLMRPLDGIDDPFEFDPYDQ